MLEKYVHNPAVVGKVTVVKSFQVGREFAGLPFPSTTLESVFRGRPIGLGTGPFATVKNAIPVASGVAAPNNSLSSLAQLSASGQNTKRSSPPTTYASRAAGPQGSLQSSTSDPRPLPVFGPRSKDIILVNADGHRIDMPLPPKSAAAADSFYRKTRTDGKRFCNMYHLYGSCSGNCSYLHDPLPAGEKLVMRHNLRAEKCHDRGNCRDPLCFYGHHCACSGLGKKCSFPLTMHGVDVTSWREVNTAVSSG